MSDYPRSIFSYQQTSISGTLASDLLPQFKNHARISFDNDDLLIESYLDNAINFLEQLSNVHILARITTISILPGFEQPSGFFSLPITPITAAMDFNGVAIPLYNKDSSNAIPLWSQLVNTPQFPIVCDTGYTISTIPSQLKVAIFRYASFLYENRESHLDVGLSACPDWWAECVSSSYVVRC